jgi:hypothetical protein
MTTRRTILKAIAGITAVLKSPSAAAVPQALAASPKAAPISIAPTPIVRYDLMEVTTHDDTYRRYIPGSRHTRP